MKLEGRNVLATLEGCDKVWPVTAAELYRINLNQILSYVKKRCFEKKKT